MMQDSKIIQSGRSMLEMISVFLIMSILAIAIIGMYEYIMDYQKAEALYNDFRVRSTLAAEGKGRKFSTEMDSVSTYDKSMVLEDGLPMDGYFLITVSDIDTPICRRLIDKEWPQNSRIYINSYAYPTGVASCPEDNMNFSVAYRKLKSNAQLNPLCQGQCEGCAYCDFGECQNGCRVGFICYNEACVEGSCVETEAGEILCCPAQIEPCDDVFNSNCPCEG